jgi:translation initiation factor IF-2
MLDENSRAVKVAGPAIPVDILGLNGTPNSGDDFTVVPDEKKAREVALFRQGKYRDVKLARQQTAKLDSILANMGKEQAKVMHVVLKADVRGSLEALTASLMDIGTEEVKVHVVYGGVGGIAESDVNLAVASQAAIFGFNVRADGPAKQLIAKTGVNLRYYSVIYDMLNDVKQALSGMLSPDLREQILGIAEVRDVFRSPKLGLIAGCMVTEGTVYRNKPIRVLRDNVVIYTGELESLRRYKDTVQEVRHGMECGIGVKSYNDVGIGDQIEVFDTVEVQRSL